MSGAPQVRLKMSMDYRTTGGTRLRLALIPTFSQREKQPS